MLTAFCRIQQSKSEPDLYTLPVLVNTSLILSKSCDNMADSVALDLDNYSLNMNREYSVLQLTDHNETSNINMVASNHDIPTPCLTNVSPVHEISTTGDQLQDKEHEEAKTTPVYYSHLFQGKHVSTMRKISTTEDLPKNEDHQEIKTTLIYVQPI